MSSYQEINLAAASPAVHASKDAKPAAAAAASASSTGYSLAGSVNNLVGPISGKYCFYFYILSVLAVFFFAIVLIAIIYTGVTKKMGASFYFLSILYSCQFLLLYLQNRLLYNMCVHSI